MKNVVWWRGFWETLDNKGVDKNKEVIVAKKQKFRFSKGKSHALC